MIDFLLISLIVITFIIVAVLAWVVLEQKKLRQDYEQLTHSVDRINKDIIGLCSAAISVDNRISENNEQLKTIFQKADEVDQNGHQYNQPYDSAIQRVRNGESIEELILHCGLSRDEAELLIRLHS
ncbi:MAG: DUF2802 domain-containing protein [Methylococcales bacterium]|nr:DUF2802 domain-containing protein [Methylococcales bacterium]